MCSETSLNHTFRSVWNSALGAMVAVPESASGHSSASVPRRKGLRSVRSDPSALALCVALAWGGSAGIALANPEGGVVVAGQASMVTTGNKLLVTTQNAVGTNHSAINWQSFSIPTGSSTYFQQPSAASTVINQVVTNTPSLIFGTLGSNGNVVLVNQSGITVGAGAVVDTAGFTASALRLSDADARAGRLNFGDANSSDGTVSVQGSILARSGDVVLIAAHIEAGKDALIQAPNGSTLLVAGQRIGITGRGLEGISLEVQAPTDSAVNLGTLQGDAVGIFAATLKHSGVIQANAVSAEGGRVVLKGASTLDVDGTVQARARGQRGGSILASAQHVVLGNTAVLDASGNMGGGEVLVGGGYQGHDARLVNAQTTTVKSGAQLRADAVTRGDGGTVVVWSDGATRYAGAISAQGGAVGGNGGRAEVSGKQYLDFQGLVDLRAAQGSKGSLLLDPLNIVVGDCADISGTNCGYGSDIVTGSDLSDSSSYAGATSYITASAVSSLLNTADVTLAATNDITVDTTISKTGSTATTLTMNAGHDVILNADVGSTAGALNFTANAGNAISTSGATIQSNGGNITLIAAAGISAGNINANGASASSGTAGNGGAVKLTSTNGPINASSVSANGGSGLAGNMNGGSAGSINVSARASCSECGSSISSLSAVGGGGYGTGLNGSAGAISIDTDHGFNMYSVNAASLAFANSTGSIDLTETSLSGIQSLTLTAYGDISASTSGVSNFAASITGAGSLSYTNTGALTVSSIQVASGNINVDNTGALVTTGAIAAPNGSVTMTAHSPITIGTGGITAGGAIALNATTPGPASNITINGTLQSTGGSITMAAANNLVQNAGVIAAGGITATAGGAMSFGPNGYSSGSPLNYSDASGSVSPPLVPLSALVTTGGTVADFLDQFLAALDVQQTFSDDPFDPRNRRTAGLVVEGQICTP